MRTIEFTVHRIKGQIHKYNGFKKRNADLCAVVSGIGPLFEMDKMQYDHWKTDGFIIFGLALTSLM